MGMHGAAPVAGWAGLHQVPVVDQNVPDVRVLGGAHLAGHGARRLQPLLAITFAQTEQTQTSPVGVFGVTWALQHQLNGLSAGQTNALAPCQQPLG